MVGVEDSVARRVLRLEDPCRAGEREDLLVDTGGLHDAAVLGDVAEEHGEATVLEVGVGHTADTAVFAVGVEAVPAGALAEGHGRADASGSGTVELLHLRRRVAHDVPFVESGGHRRGVDGGLLGVEESGPVEFAEDAHDAAGSVDVFDVVRVGGGRDLADGGGGPAESIDVGHREVDVRLAGGSENVQHGVGGAAHRDVEGHRVLERLLGADRAGEDRVVLFLVVPRGEIDDLATGLKEKPLAIAVGGDHGAVARQRQTERLCEAVHRVGGEHARTRPTGRAGGALHLLHVFVADGRVAGLDHRVDEVELDLDAGELGLSGLHWSAGDEDRRDVEAHRRHQHAGRDLVAVGDAHQRVGAVGVDHVLD